MIDPAQIPDEVERLRAYALKAFTVVEFCAGEGLLLPHPHYDCDDLLIEGVDLLKVETSEEARAAIAAGLSAWPGMQRRFHIEQALVLPLTEGDGQ